MLQRRPYKRRMERVPLEIPAVMVGGLFMRVKVRDLSLGGLFFECPKPPARGTVVTVRFTLPQERVTIEMVGEVRFRRRDGAGIRVIRLPISAREAIQRFTQSWRGPR